eukprot:1514724-Pleurochrysis_carterae.AAC.3
MHKIKPSGTTEHAMHGTELECACVGTEQPLQFDRTRHEGGKGSHEHSASGNHDRLPTTTATQLTIAQEPVDSHKAAHSKRDRSETHLAPECEALTRGKRQQTENTRHKHKVAATYTQQLPCT